MIINVSAKNGEIICVAANYIYIIIIKIKNRKIRFLLGMSNLKYYLKHKFFHIDLQIRFWQAIEPIFQLNCFSVILLLFINNYKHITYLKSLSEEASKCAQSSITKRPLEYHQPLFYIILTNQTEST